MGDSDIEMIPLLSPYFSFSWRKAKLECLAGQTRPCVKNKESGDFPGGAVVKNPPANAGDTGSIPGPGRSHMLQSN